MLVAAAASVAASAMIATECARAVPPCVMSCAALVEKRYSCSQIRESFDGCNCDACGCETPRSRPPPLPPSPLPASPSPIERDTPLPDEPAHTHAMPSSLYPPASGLLLVLLLVVIASLCAACSAGATLPTPTLPRPSQPDSSSHPAATESSTSKCCAGLCSRISRLFGRAREPDGPLLGATPLLLSDGTRRDGAPVVMFSPPWSGNVARKLRF